MAVPDRRGQALPGRLLRLAPGDDWQQRPDAGPGRARPGVERAPAPDRGAAPVWCSAETR